MIQPIRSRQIHYFRCLSSSKVAFRSGYIVREPLWILVAWRLSTIGFATRQQINRPSGQGKLRRGLDFELTLAVHALVWLTVRRMRRRVIRVHVILVVGHGLLRNASRGRRRILRRLVANRRERDRSRPGISRRRRPVGSLRLAVLGGGLGSLALAFLLGLALILLLLLAGLPLLANLLELCKRDRVSRREPKSNVDNEVPEINKIQTVGGTRADMGSHDPQCARLPTGHRAGTNGVSHRGRVDVPSGVRLGPCDCIVTWALRWLRVP